MKKAFTLIELLVVIAIIAILAAILFPVFAQAKEAAKKTQAISNTKQMGTATLIYAADYDDTFPNATTQRADGSWRYNVAHVVNQEAALTVAALDHAGAPQCVGFVLGQRHSAVHEELQPVRTAWRS